MLELIHREFWRFCTCIHGLAKQQAMCGRMLLRQYTALCESVDNNSLCQARHVECGHMCVQKPEGPVDSEYNNIADVIGSLKDCCCDVGCYFRLLLCVIYVMLLLRRSKKGRLREWCRLLLLSVIMCYSCAIPSKETQKKKQVWRWEGSCTRRHVLYLYHYVLCFLLYSMMVTTMIMKWKKDKLEENE